MNNEAGMHKNAEWRFFYAPSSVLLSLGDILPQLGFSPSLIETSASASLFMASLVATAGSRARRHSCGGGAWYHVA